MISGSRTMGMQELTNKFQLQSQVQKKYISGPTPIRAKSVNKK